MAGVTKKAKLPRPELEQTSRAEQFLVSEQQTLEREKEKERIKTLAQQRVQEIQTKASLEAVQLSCSATHPMTQMGSECKWQQCYSPEGYVYYYNNDTGGIYIYTQCSATVLR